MRDFDVCSSDTLLRMQKDLLQVSSINRDSYAIRVYEGNTSDIPTLKDMIEDLKAHSGNNAENVVVMDAGIASEENLTYLYDEGLKYVCVARKQIKDYKMSIDEPVTRITDKRDNPIELQVFSPSGYSDTWMCVKSQHTGKRAIHQ